MKNKNKEWNIKKKEEVLWKRNKGGRGHISDQESKNAKVTLALVCEDRQARIHGRSPKEETEKKKKDKTISFFIKKSH